MPIYEYRCNECGHQFEVSQRMSDDPLTECEVCGGAVAKVLFAPAIHFKGTGFHNTDYGTRRRGAGGDEGGSGGGEGGGAGEAVSPNGASAGTPAAKPTTTSSSGASSGTTVGLDKV